MDVLRIRSLPSGSDEFEPQELVRVFSMSLKTKHEDCRNEESGIEIALLEDFELKERRRQLRIKEIEDYFNSTRPNELADLNNKKKALELALKDFHTLVQTTCPEDLQSKLDSWEAVKSVVERVRVRLEAKQDKNKFRRATKHLRSFCNTIKAHSTALKMIPSNSEYVSVLYGSLATVIQASESYTKVMEALAQSLSEINNAVSAIEKRLWLFNNNTMKSHAWRMYSQVFSFLTEVLRWYTKRSYQRLLGSFNEYLPEFFEDQLDEIRKSAELIHQEAHLRSQADAQMNRLYLEGLNEKFDKFLLDLREGDRKRHDASDRRYEEFCDNLNVMRRKELQDENVLRVALNDVWIKIGRQETGSAVARILEGTAQEHIAQRAVTPQSLAIQDRNIEEDQDTANTGQESITRDAILSYSARLERFFDREKVSRDEPLDNFFTDATVVHRIQEWALATDAQVLYIAEADSTSVRDIASSTAARYAALARDSSLPVCSHFCDLAHEDPPEGRTRETVELTSLVYSLIRQLIELLPSTMTRTTFPLEEAHFDVLEGTLNSFPQALRILDYLLDLTGHVIVVLVIDGLDVLDDPSFGSTTTWLRRFVDTIIKHRDNNQASILKVLFTSAGISTPLYEALDATDILLTSTPQRRYGRPSMGEEPLIL